MNTTAPAGSDVIEHRDRVKALLGSTLEALLSDGVARSDANELDSVWDGWWVAYRAARPAAELGIDLNRVVTRCPDCRADVSTLAASDPPRHPDVLADRSCRCLRRWAVRMRQPGPEVDWPPLRLSLAMVKPCTDAAQVHQLLAEHYQVIETIERQLTVTDVRRLYPDAYGAQYVARQDAYLTCGPVHILVLVAPPGTAVNSKVVKDGIRRAMGGGDLLRNHVHMPDNPGDALCDIDHLAGRHILHQLYGRYDRDDAATRLAHYRAVLARR